MPFSTSGTTLDGMVAGGVLGVAYIYPGAQGSGLENDTNPWGLWAGVIPGAMIGSMLASSITGSVLGAYAKNRSEGWSLIGRLKMRCLQFPWRVPSPPDNWRCLK